MARFIWIGLLAIMVLPVIIGCKTTKGDTEIRAYIQETPRIDQEMSGNAGYLFGTPEQPDRSNIKDTRRIYVLEFNKGPEGESVDMDYNVDTSITIPERRKTSSSPVQSSRPRITLPSFDDVDSDPAPAAPRKVNKGVEFIEYKVQKEDTLQKISKKFYDGYSKWPRIYEANKDVISNPDHIDPGITIMIPVE